MLGYVEVMAHRRAADGEAIDLHLRLAGRGHDGADLFGQAFVMRHLESLDIAVANHGDPLDAGAPLDGVVAEARIPPLRIDREPGGDFIADAPDPRLAGRIADDAVDIGVPGQIGAGQQKSKHDQLEHEQREYDRPQRNAEIDRDVT